MKQQLNCKCLLYGFKYRLILFHFIYNLGIISFCSGDLVVLAVLTFNMTAL